MAQNYTDSNRGVLRSVGGQDYSFVPTYLRPRNPISPTSASPDIKPKEQQGHYPVSSLWTNTVNQNVYVLAGIVNNLANWVLITSGGSGPMLMVGVPFGASPVTPDINGLLNFTSTLGTITITGSAGGVGAQNINFDLTGGSLGVDSFAVQATTAPGVSPVTPTGAGLITFNGNAVVNHSVPVETRSRALNAMNLEVQYSTSAAATDATKSGLAHFNSSEFTVDANGFVALTGGGAAIDQVAVDANTAPGTNPVLPNGAGQITVTGAQVAAGVVGTNVIRTDSLAANTYTIEVQRSTAVAASAVANNGVSHYKNTDFTVDANAFVSLNPLIIPTNGVFNLGITYAASTFSVTAADGTALSATNPAYVWLQSTTSGLQTKYTITANQSFIDDSGASQIVGNTFGTTAGIAWATDMPFYLYAVAKSDQTALAFMISRVPHRHISPAAGNIAKAGSAVASTQGSFFSLANVTVADYAGTPCSCIGSFRMQKTTGATDDWTVSALSYGGDGINLFNEAYGWLFPTGQNGNASGKYFRDNGGTAPTFTNQSVSYGIQKDGYVKALFIFDNNTATGAGAVLAQMSLPLINPTSGFVGTGFFLIAAATQYSAINCGIVGTTTDYVNLYYSNELGTGILTNANMNGANNQGVYTVYYPCGSS